MDWNEKPYNDDSLVYDKANHRYVLAEAQLSAEQQQMMRDVEGTLSRESRLLYIWIYSKVPTYNRKFAEWVLAHDESYRQAIANALWLIAEADLNANYTATAYAQGDPDTGAFANNLLVMDHIVPPTAQSAIVDSGSPINIFWPGHRAFAKVDRAFYEKEGY